MDVNIAASSGATFVTTSLLTVAELLANFPAGAVYQGLYARVTDLYGDVDEVVRCRKEDTTYRWVPQRSEYSKVLAQTSGTITFTPLVTPPTIFLSATLLGNLTVNLFSTNAYSGQPCRIVAPALLGVFSLNFTGLISGVTSTLARGDSTAQYTSTGWRT